MIDELSTLMQFHSVSTNQGAVAKLLEYVAGRLSNKGLHIEYIEHEGVRSLYASTQGKTHAKVLLQAHVDVVPGGSEFRQKNGKIYGRGCYDMLFAVASYLQLIDTLDDVRAYDIALLFTGDEELGGLHGVGEIMKTPDYTADVCILPDAGEGMGTLSVGAKGLWQQQFRVDGRSHHASRPWEGDNAAEKLVLFLDELRGLFDEGDKEASTLTISQLQAGSSAINQGPAVATAGIDIRFTDEDDRLRLRDGIEQLKVKYQVATTSEQIGRSYVIDATTPLIRSFIEIYRSSIGRDITTHRAYGSSDARFFDEKDIPVIMLRPDGGGAHGDEEWLSIEAWIQFQGIITRYVQEIAYTSAPAIR